MPINDLFLVIDEEELEEGRSQLKDYPDYSAFSLVLSKEVISGLHRLSSFLNDSTSRESRAIVLAYDNHRFEVGMVEPKNGARMDKVARALGVSSPSIKRCYISQAQFEQLYSCCYGSSQEDKKEEEEARTTKTWSDVIGVDLDEDILRFEDDEDTNLNLEEIESRGAKDMSGFVRKILLEAYHAGASDIHLDPGVTRGSIRLRIDGMLHTKLSSIPLNNHKQIINAVAAAAQVPTHRMGLEPLDGTIKTAIREKKTNSIVLSEYRVALIPAKTGVKATIRQNVKPISDIKLIGFDERQLEDISLALREPHGLILITGPTGSGKSNTREAVLDIIKKERDPAIFEIGNPIEFPADGRCQISITENTTWERAVRAALRSDPDVISPSEFRDENEAKIVIDSAITGHLVPTTFHTNDVASTFSRLQQMGIRPYLQAESIKLIVSQRLVRVLCQECRLPDLEMSDRLNAEVFRHPEQNEIKAGICRNCKNHGYRGRTAIAEVLLVSRSIREIIAMLGMPKASGMDMVKGTDIVEKAVNTYGMSTLEDSAVRKMREGITSRAEVERVISLATTINEVMIERRAVARLAEQTATSYKPN
jgi:type IV pilus assembly protein PilB